MSPKRAWQVSSSHCALRNQITLWIAPGRRGPGGNSMDTPCISLRMLTLLDRSRFLQTVVSPEDLLANSNRRHAEDTAHVGCVGGVVQCQLDLGIARSPGDRLTVQAGLLSNLEHVLLDREIVAAGEGMAEGLDSELASTADLEGIGHRTHRVQIVGRPRLRPAHGLQAIVARASLDLRDPHSTAVHAGERPRGASVGLEQTTKRYGLPDSRLRQDVVDALGGQVGVRRSEVEVESAHR